MSILQIHMGLQFLLVFFLGGFCGSCSCVVSIALLSGSACWFLLLAFCFLLIAFCFCCFCFLLSALYRFCFLLVAFSLMRFAFCVLFLLSAFVLFAFMCFGQKARKVATKLLLLLLLPCL